MLFRGPPGASSAWRGQQDFPGQGQPRGSRGLRAEEGAGPIAPRTALTYRAACCPSSPSSATRPFSRATLALTSTCSRGLPGQLPPVWLLMLSGVVFLSGGREVEVSAACLQSLALET